MNLAICSCVGACSSQDLGVALSKQPKKHSRWSPMRHGCAQRPRLHQSELSRCFAKSNQMQKDYGLKMGIQNLGCDLEPQKWWRGAAAGVAVGLHLTMSSLVTPGEALAVLNAPKAVLPRTAEAALRRSIPAFNENVSQVQVCLLQGCQIQFYWIGCMAPVL